MGSDFQYLMTCLVFMFNYIQQRLRCLFHVSSISNIGVSIYQRNNKNAVARFTHHFVSFQKKRCALHQNGKLCFASHIQCCSFLL